MQLLSKNKHSLHNFQRLEMLDHIMKRHTTTPDLNLNKLDSTNSLTLNTLNKSETNSTKLRTITGRTEECSPNLLGKKPEIKPLVMILRNSKTRLLKVPRLMLKPLRNSRLTSILRSLRPRKRLISIRKKKESKPESKLMSISSKKNGMREIKPLTTLH